MRRNAFTLVELLTVVAILAILYAVFMPVFMQVKKFAQQYVAGQSMMKLGTATNMYMADNDEYYPLGYYHLPTGQRQNWFGIVGPDGEVNPDTGLLAPYMHGKIQPDYTLFAQPWLGDKTGFGYNWGYLGSDFYIPGGQSNWYTCQNPAPGSLVADPSKTFEFSTSAFYFAPWLTGGDGITYRYGFIDPPKAWFGNPTMEFRHMGDRNVDKKKHTVDWTGQALVVYADGHLRTIKQKEVKDEMFERGEFTYGGAN